MILIAGLGNPTEEYAHTRHNAGFDAIDALASSLNANYWKTECGALTAKVKIRRTIKEADGSVTSALEEVILAKPQSYMNTSGGPIKQICTTYGITPDEVIVIHDDLDLPIDTLRVKLGGGHAGHNGLKSIIDKLGTKDYYRIRVGIGHPEHGDVIDYVLGRPKKEEKDAFESNVVRAAEAAEYLVVHGLQKTQQQFN